MKNIWIYRLWEIRNFGRLGPSALFGSRLRKMTKFKTVYCPGEIYNHEVNERIVDFTMILWSWVQLLIQPLSIFLSLSIIINLSMHLFVCLAFLVSSSLIFSFACLSTFLYFSTLICRCSVPSCYLRLDYSQWDQQQIKKYKIKWM